MEGMKRCDRCGGMTPPLLLFKRLGKPYDYCSSCYMHLTKENISNGVQDEERYIKHRM